jgi:hypothetical protein
LRALAKAFVKEHIAVPASFGGDFENLTASFGSLVRDVFETNGEILMQETECMEFFNSA